MTIAFFKLTFYLILEAFLSFYLVTFFSIFLLAARSAERALLVLASMIFIALDSLTFLARLELAASLTMILLEEALLMRALLIFD